MTRSAKNSRLSKSESNDLTRVAELYSKIMKTPAEEQERVLAAEAGADEELKKEILQLLKLPSKVRGILDRRPQVDLSEVGDALPEFSKGTKVDDFTIERELGRGGMGVVYLAKQNSLDRMVAIKISSRAGREAHIMAHLEHDNIVKVHFEKKGIEDRWHLICMQYIEGVSLGDILRAVSKNESLRKSANPFFEILNASTENRLDFVSPRSHLDLFETLLWIGSQLSKALGYAHRKGVLHLDVKPGNVLVSLSGRPFLTDFNVSWDARELRAGKHPIFGGTVDYMAPEQHRLMESGDLSQIQRIDGRADIYSLGILLEELYLALLSTGRQRLTKYTVIEKNFLEILKKCKEADRNKRFSSVVALAHSIDGCSEMLLLAKYLPEVLGGERVYQTVERSLIGMWIALPLIGSGLVFLYIALVCQTIYSPRAALTIAVLGFLVNGFAILFTAKIGSSKIKESLRFFSIQAHSLENPYKTSKHRRQILSIPFHYLKNMTFIWLPLNLVVVGLVSFSLGFPNVQILGRFLIAVSSMGLGVTALGVILSFTEVLLKVYPHAWLGSSKIGKRAGLELNRFVPRLEGFYSSLVAAPLIAGLLGFIDYPMLSHPFLMGFLILLSFFGIGAVFPIHQRLTRMILTFSMAQRSQGEGRI